MNIYILYINNKISYLFNFDIIKKLKTKVTLNKGINYLNR